MIATYTTSSGVLVRIHDDSMAAPGSEEERRIIEAQRRAAHAILLARAEKEAKP